MPEFTNDLTHDDLALLLLLAEKRSLTRSAMTLAWSTPKASHRLNHARALIGDELFVRSGNSLVPTKRMEALVPTMRRALVLRATPTSWPQTTYSGAGSALEPVGNCSPLLQFK